MTTPFRYYLRVRYQECDAQHVVFNARYGDYIDLACFEFLRAALPRPTDVMDGTFEMPDRAPGDGMEGPARFDDVLEISAWASRIGTTSFTLERRDAARRRSATRWSRPRRPTCTSTPRLGRSARSSPAMRAALEAGAAARPSTTPAICVDGHPGISRRGISGTQAVEWQSCALGPGSRADALRPA